MAEPASEAGGFGQDLFSPLQFCEVVQEGQAAHHHVKDDAPRHQNGALVPHSSAPTPTILAIQGPTTSVPPTTTHLHLQHTPMPQMVQHQHVQQHVQQQQQQHHHQQQQQIITQNQLLQQQINAQQQAQNLAQQQMLQHQQQQQQQQQQVQHIQQQTQVQQQTQQQVQQQVQQVQQQTQQQVQQQGALLQSQQQQAAKAQLHHQQQQQQVQQQQQQVQQQQQQVQQQQQQQQQQVQLAVSSMQVVGGVQMPAIAVHAKTTQGVAVSAASSPLIVITSIVPGMMDDTGTLTQPPTPVTPASTPISIPPATPIPAPATPATPATPAAPATPAPPATTSNTHGPAPSTTTTTATTNGTSNGEAKPVPVKRTWRRPWKKKKEREKKQPVKKARRVKRKRIVVPKKSVIHIDPRNGPPIDTAATQIKRESEEAINQLKQKRQRIKLNRNSGREYVNRLGKVVGARYIGNPCNCPLKCWDRMGSKILEIFNNFWDLSDFNLQNSYLFTCLKLCDVKRRYTKKVNPAEESRRQNTFEYFVRISGKHLKVCKRAFMSSHGLTSDKRLRTLFHQMKDGALVPEPDRRGKHLRPAKSPGQMSPAEHIEQCAPAAKTKKPRVKKKQKPENKPMYTPPPPPMGHIHPHCTPPPPPAHSTSMQEPPHAYIPNGEIYFPGHYLEPHQSMAPPPVNQIPSCQKMLEAPAYFMAGMKENTFHQ